MQVLVEYSGIEFRALLPELVKRALPGVKHALEVVAGKDVVPGEGDRADLPLFAGIEILGGQSQRHGTERDRNQRHQSG